jgi:hypothetical protein
VNRHRTDVAAGEKNRPHDVGIRRHRQSSGGNLKLRRVVARVENRVAERLAKNIFEQPVHQLAAAAMRQQYVRILRDGNRAGGDKIVLVGHGQVGEIRMPKSECRKKSEIRSSK